MKKIFSEQFFTFFFIFFAIFIFSQKIFSQSHFSTQSHTKSVSCFTTKNLASQNLEQNKSFFSFSEDGFAVKWSDDGLGEHYQLTDLQIKFASENPNNQDIAIYETDGEQRHIVSVWNWKTLQKKFSLKFSDPITFLSYSEKGTFLMCATSSVNAIRFFNANTGTSISKISEKTGIITLLKTSKTEKSLCAYSPDGFILYYNLQNGSQKAKFSCESDLQNPCVFNNEIFLAGIKNEKIYIVDMQSGKTISSFNAKNPILLPEKNGENLFFLCDFDLKKCLAKLFYIQNEKNKFVSSPKMIQNLSFLELAGEFTSGAKDKNQIFLGTRDGTIYTFSDDFFAQVDFENQAESGAEKKTLSISPLTENMYESILDVAAEENDFYFLTKNALYKSSFENAVVEKKCLASFYKNIATYENGVIFWSRDSARAPQFFNAQNQTLSNFFTSEGAIQSLKIFGENVITVEANSAVWKFDLNTKERTELYRGSAIQDAILIGENLYCAKIASANSKSALLQVNCKTRETLSLTNPRADYICALCVAENPANKFFGVSVFSENAGKNISTAIFSFNTETKSSYFVQNLKILEEDFNASLATKNQKIYTNLGKSFVRTYDFEKKRLSTFNRSTSIPVKIECGKNQIVVLNCDGSISWYNLDSEKVLADWYLSTNGQWFEF